MAGSYRIGPANGEIGTQRYLPNTNILETTFQHLDRLIPGDRFRSSLPAVRPRVSADAIDSDR